MKKIFPLLLSVSFFQLNAQPDLQPVDHGVIMIGMVVSDIEKSEKFYTEIIGMESTGGFELSPEWSENAGMAAGQPFKVKTFQMKKQNAATVLKLAYFDKVNSRPNPAGIQQLPGVNYLTFLYEDIKPVLSRVKANDIKIVGTAGDRLVIIRDPDGIYLELYQPL
jgi:catechol 2,3-dioxygenase-like lactoylglutathione lyase family enzyme